MPNPIENPKMNRISSSIVEHGLARLVFHEPSYTLRGILLNEEGASFSLSGHLTARKSFPMAGELLRKMHIAIVDDETGEKFCVDEVVIRVVRPAEGQGSQQQKIEIDSPAIKFRTEEVLFGMRAEVEIRRYLDPTDPLMRTNGVKGVERRVVHVGKMQLRIVASQKRAIAPTRRTSISQPNESIIECAPNDFLV